MPRTASIGVAWNELERTPPGTAADSHQPAATPGNRGRSRYATPAGSFCFAPLRPWIWTIGGASSFRTCWR